ncbi:MAG: hypothetical protein ACPGJV_09270 [Bacteriovoracaceae bacterium]
MQENKVLIFDNNDFLSDIYKENLRVYVNCSCEVVRDLKEAYLEIQKQKDIGCIIVKKNIGKTAAGKSILKFLDKQNQKTPVIVFDGESLRKEYENVVALKNLTDVRALVRIVAKIFNISAKDMLDLEVEEFFVFPAKLFFPKIKYEMTIFRKDGANHKEIKKNESFAVDELNAIKKSDDPNLYVHSLDRLKFVNMTSEIMISTLNKKNLSTEDRIIFTQISFDVVSDLVSKIGIDAHTAELAQASINSMQKLSRQIPSLDKLLEDLVNNEASYRYKRCLLVTIVGTRIIEVLKWGNQDQVNKLAFVAFFHDITLADDKLARIHSMGQLHTARLDEENVSIVLNHAVDAARLVSQYPKFPLGVDTIIKQHHGSKNGVGFDKISLNISPLSIIFIIAEEWSNLAIDSQEKGIKLSKDKVVAHLRKKYNLPRFKEYMVGLDKLQI